MIRLELSRLDAAPGARDALDAIWKVMPEARLVGGSVRDLIAGRRVADLDLGTPEPPHAVMQRLREAGIRSLATGLAHGTITGLVAGHPIEITTLRRDEQTDGRHAVVAWTNDWREDACRRDFTINAMSLSRGGELFDYFEGFGDLASGRVRFVGEAARRIAEDALRILRFFRFEARYGRGEPDRAATDAIGGSLVLLDRLSPERLWSELRRILVGPDLDATLLLMRRLGVLDRLLPGGVLLRGGAMARLPADPVLRLAGLIAGPAAGAVAEGLRLSRRDAERLRALLAAPAPDLDPDEAALRRLLCDDPADLLCGRAWLAELASGRDSEAWERLRGRLRGAVRPVFPLAGRDALALGLPPGPAVGQLLAQTRAWWRAGGCSAGHDACLEQLRTLGGIPLGTSAC